MSEDGELRKSLVYFSLFSVIVGFYLTGAMFLSLHWVSRVIGLLAAIGMGYIALLEYREIIELYREQTSSDSSSSEGREVIPVEVDESP